MTDAASIAAAAEAVRAGADGAGLAALVNNAGVAVSAPVEYVPIDECAQLEVNVIGQVAVTQAFLPRCAQARRPRIVNVSSIGGRIALPLAGPYAASKFALEAVSDSLRRELRAKGVDVSLIEPGGVKTPIWEKGTATAEPSSRGDAARGPRAPYGKLEEGLRKEVRAIATKTGMEPSAVAEAIGTRVTADKPKTRYLVGRDAKLRWAIAKRLPDRAFDTLIARALPPE